MSKITIVGISQAGKTCYMISMFSKMNRGVDGFSLTSTTNFQDIKRMIRRLGDKNLPIEQRLPVLSNNVEKYHLSLKYTLKELSEIEWIDYPGGQFENDNFEDSGNIEFCEHVTTSDCLFLCVDGSAFSKGENTDISNELFYNQGGMDTNNLLQHVSDANNGYLPKICIIITKYDKVPEEKRGKKTIYNIVSEVFPVLFEKTNFNQRVVGICPVTLGKYFETEGKLDPQNVEKPILFSTFFEVSEKLIRNREKLNLSQSDLNRLSGGRIRNWWNSTERSQAKEDIKKYEGMQENLIQSLQNIKKEIKNVPLYINGEEIEWDSI